MAETTPPEPELPDSEKPDSGLPEDRRTLLQREYHGQTARIQWEDLQVHYARGAVVRVAPGMDLVAVAVELGMDNAEQFSAWIESGEITRVTEDEARAYFEANTEFWAVVPAPWVLIQPVDAG